MSEHHAPSAAPTLPEVHDEAADSPLWLPAVGFAILGLVFVFLTVMQATAEEPESAPAEEVPVADTVPAE